MNPDRIVVLELSRLEATHLAGLVMQFAEVLEETGDATPDDPAVLRLVPDAYTDPAAAREFRELTQRELLERRAEDAATVLESLRGTAAEDASTLADDGSAADDTALIRLDSSQLHAWLRTLAAIRLVLASRLGIVEEEDHDEDDPRFGVYEWIGYRLDGLVRAADADE